MDLFKKFCILNKRKTVTCIELILQVNNANVGSDYMKKTISKVVNFEEYKDKKRQIEVNRDELLKLIKSIATIK